MIYVSLGRRERGKTTLVRFFVKRLLDGYPAAAVLSFDPRGILDSPRARRVTSADGLVDAMPGLIDGDYREIIYAPAENDVAFAFRVFARQVKYWVMYYPARPLGVCVDEVSFVDLTDPAFQWVTRCCPRQTVDIFLTTHRPADLPTQLRAITDYWCLFPCRQEHDLAVIRERCGDDVVSRVKQLRNRSFILWDDEHGQARDFPDRPHPVTGKNHWYVPLASSPLH